MPVDTSINFLADKQNKYRLQARRLLIIQATSFSFFTIYLLAIAGMFAYSFYLTRQKTQLDRQKGQVAAQIQELTAKEAKYIFIKTKAESLVPVFASKQKHQELTEAIFSLLPPGMSIQGFTITEEGDINFGGEATTFDSFRRFIANIEEVDLTPSVKVKFAKLDSFSFKSDGGYAFSVTLKLETK